MQDALDLLVGLLVPVLRGCHIRIKLGCELRSFLPGLLDGVNVFFLRLDGLLPLFLPLLVEFLLLLIAQICLFGHLFGVSFQILCVVISHIENG